MSKKVLKFTAVASVFVGTLVVASVFAFNAVRHFLIEDNEMLAHAVAQSILPALLVNDTHQVESMMRALESYPGIESAELLSAEGASIASYAKAGHAIDPMSAGFELASAATDPNQVHVMAPITFDSLIVGNLHLAVNLWPTYLRIMTWLGLLLMVPTVTYVLVKQFRIKLRFEKVHKADGDSSSRGEGVFDVEQAVSVAMRDADISLDYQPIQRMSDGGLFGMEVLVCWHHPSGQTIHVSPADFVTLAQKNDICVSFDDWLISTACQQAVAWQHQFGPLVLTINISETQFMSPTFASKVRDVCVQTQYPHQLLELEVNESVLARCSDRGLASIQKFSELGLSVTVDKFGLSRNSSELIGLLPIQKVKLDRNLVKCVGRDAQVEQFLDEIIALALSQDVQVMVEGVDMLGQHARLQKMGCILGQGAYFSAPLTASAFESFLATRPFGLSKSNGLNGNVQRNRWNHFSAA